MGKIRVKTFGDEEKEKEQQKESQKRKEAKKIGKAPGLKGGERINVIGPTEEELEKMAQEPHAEEKIEKEVKLKKKRTKKTKQKAARSRKYKEAKTQVDHTKTYLLSDALELLTKV